MPGIPDLSTLPLWQQILAVIVAGAVAGIGLLVTRLGFLTGKDGRKTPQAHAAEVAAVIVDDKALNRLTGEVSGLQVALLELAREVREAVTGQGRTQEVNAELARKVDQLAESTDRLKEELIRAAATRLN